MGVFLREQMKKWFAPLMSNKLPVILSGVPIHSSPARRFDLSLHHGMALQHTRFLFQPWLCSDVAGELSDDVMKTRDANIIEQS